MSHTLRSSAFPIALIDSETLIVFGDIPEEDQLIDYYFYLMDTNGNYIDKINNSHLEYINRNGIITKAAQSLDYNTSSNLLVFSSIDSTVSGYKIAVTDLTGNYYKEYTQGDYLDDHPKWGPDGTILFDRRALNDHSNTGYKIMKINTETGEVTEFLSPNELPGAISLRYPEF